MIEANEVREARLYRFETWLKETSDMLCKVRWFMRKRLFSQCDGGVADVVYSGREYGNLPHLLRDRVGNVWNHKRRKIRRSTVDQPLSAKAICEKNLLSMAEACERRRPLDRWFPEKQKKLADLLKQMNSPDLSLAKRLRVKRYFERAAEIIEFGRDKPVKRKNSAFCFALSEDDSVYAFQVSGTCDYFSGSKNGGAFARRAVGLGFIPADLSVMRSLQQQRHNNIQLSDFKSGVHAEMKAIFVSSLLKIVSVAGTDHCKECVQMLQRVGVFHQGVRPSGRWSDRHHSVVSGAPTDYRRMGLRLSNCSPEDVRFVKQLVFNVRKKGDDLFPRIVETKAKVVGVVFRTKEQRNDFITLIETARKLPSSGLGESLMVASNDYLSGRKFDESAVHATFHLRFNCLLEASKAQRDCAEVRCEQSARCPGC